MLTDPKLRSQVNALWDKFWTGGLANPLNEQRRLVDYLDDPPGEAYLPAGDAVSIPEGVGCPAAVHIG